MTPKEALQQARQRGSVARCTAIGMRSATNAPTSATTPRNTSATTVTQAPESLESVCNGQRNSGAIRGENPCNKQPPKKPDLLHGKTHQSPTTAKVWKAVIDGRQITVIDPDRCTPEEMLRTLEQKFGTSRVTTLTEQ